VIASVRPSCSTTTSAASASSSGGSGEPDPFAGSPGLQDPDQLLRARIHRDDHPIGVAADERVAQALDRDGEPLPLGLERSARGVEVGRHRVEALPQLAQLARPVGIEPRLEVASRDPPGRVHELVQRAAQAPDQQRGQGERGEHGKPAGHGDREDRLPGVGACSVSRRRAPGALSGVECRHQRAQVPARQCALDDAGAGWRRRARAGAPRRPRRPRRASAWRRCARAAGESGARRAASATTPAASSRVPLVCSS